MSTKPFSLQSPEQIAKDYSGNKQKIAQAAQMGLVDSTAAVLAGMFIDRMRSAQMLEQQPQQTVAQQVLSPQPQAAPPPAPPQGGAPMGMAGAPPVGGMQQRLGMATQQGGTPVPAPQAAGPGFAEGGLASLPVPDGMFDEPSGGGFNEGYAGGGIVAFADGGEAEEPAIFLAGKYFDPVTGVEVKTPYGGRYVAGEFDTSLGSGRRFRPKKGATPQTLAPRPKDYVPFGGEGTYAAKTGSVGGGALRTVRALGDLTGDIARSVGEDVARDFDYGADRGAFDAATFNNMQARLVGGTTPTPPVALPRRTPRPAAPAARPTSAAKPAAAKPATAAAPTPRAGSPAPGVSMSQLQAALAGGITPRPTAVAPRVGAPASAAPRVAPTPAAPRVGGGVPSAPRVGGVAPAGPALPASPAAAPGGAPFTLGGMSEDPAANIAALKALAPQDTTMRDAMAKRYADMSSPEALAAQKKQDFWGSLAQIGFGMAGSNSPHFLQAVGQSASAALPGMAQAAKERKAQELAGLQGQLGIETARNQEASALAKYGQELAAQVASGKMTKENADRNYALAVRQLDAQIAADQERNAISRAGLAQRGSGGGGGAAAGGGKPLTLGQAMALVTSEIASSRDKAVRNMTTEQKLARAREIVAASSGGGAAPASTAPVRVYDPKTGTFR